MNWRDLKTGDRVRVTLEGEVLNRRPGHDYGLPVLFDGPVTAGGMSVPATYLDAHSARVERLDPPFKVGDPVDVAGFLRVGRIVAIQDEWAWVVQEGEGCAPSTHAVSKLRRCSDAP